MHRYTANGGDTPAVAAIGCGNASRGHDASNDYFHGRPSLLAMQAKRSRDLTDLDPPANVEVDAETVTWRFL